MNSVSALICPLCQHALSLNERVLRCGNNHCFDLAKEGYVNLLPAQFKHSKNPGDDKAMLIARRAFLEAGFYSPLKRKIAEIVSSTEYHSQALDLGCGEGYYTDALNKAEQVYALDIAKDGVRLGSKKNKQVNYVVASSHATPFKNKSFDIVLSCFAPFSDLELLRVLSDNGTFIQISPAPRHLHTLKSFIYDEVTLHPLITEQQGLVLAQQQELTFAMQFDDEAALSSLLDMTPFTWRISNEKRQLLLTKLPLEIEASFTISVWNRP